jgi:hypothetical protein
MRNVYIVSGFDKIKKVRGGVAGMGCWLWYTAPFSVLVSTSKADTLPR